MRGATAPRLLLEVVCARLLLPSASDTESALLQRASSASRPGWTSLPAGEAAMNTGVGTGPAVRPKTQGPPAAAAEPPAPPGRWPHPPVAKPEPSPHRAGAPPRRPNRTLRPGPHQNPPRHRPHPANPAPPPCAACGRRCGRRCASAAAPPRSCWPVRSCARWRQYWSWATSRSAGQAVVRAAQRRRHPRCAQKDALSGWTGRLRYEPGVGAPARTDPAGRTCARCGGPAARRRGQHDR